MFSLFLFAGCGGLLSVTLVEEASTTVEAGSLVEVLLGDLGFDSLVSADITAAEALANEGVEPGDLESVVVTGLTLSTPTPGVSLDFLDRLEVGVRARDLPELLVATVAEFPEGSTRVDATLTGAELVAHAASTELEAVTEAEGKRPEVDTVVHCVVTVDVRARLRALR